MLSRFFSPLIRWFGAVFGLLATVALIYRKGKVTERNRIEREALRDALDRRRVRDEVEQTITRDPDPSQRLRERWSRD